MPKTNGFHLKAAFVVLVLCPWFVGAGNRNSDKGTPAIMQTAMSEYGRGSFENALALYQKALGAVSGEFLSAWEDYIYTMIGLCHWRLADNAASIAAFNKANSLHPFVTNYVFLGYVYNHNREFAAAEANWLKARELAPLDPEHYAQLAFAQIRLGHYDQAQESIWKGRSGSRPQRSFNTLEDAQRAALLDIEKPGAASYQQGLRDSQIAIYLAKGQYPEASSEAGDAKLLCADGENATGGVRVTWVAKGGPADLAGIQPGDVMASFDGKPVGGMADMAVAISQAQFGQNVAVRVRRNGSDLDLTAIVGIPRGLAAIAGPVLLNAEPMGNRELKPQPVLEIGSFELLPPSVAPDERFSIRVGYKCRPKGQVRFQYSISSGDRIIVDSKPESFAAEDGEEMFINKKITASVDPGAYTIRIKLTGSSMTAERDAILNVVGP